MTSAANRRRPTPSRRSPAPWSAATTTVAASRSSRHRTITGRRVTAGSSASEWCSRSQWKGTWRRSSARIRPATSEVSASSVPSLRAR